MQINFQALEQALAPIADIGQGELTFEAGTTTITLRSLLPFEEVDAQKYAAIALDDTKGEHTVVDYLDRFRIGCLAHAVVCVGDQDFRNVTYVETGEKLESGVHVKIAKHKALQQLLSQWSRATLTAVFSRYHKLALKTEADAEAQIVFEPSNIPAELDRLQKRMEELRGELEQAEAAEKVSFIDKVEAAAESVPRDQASPVEATPVDEPDRSAVRRAGPISPTAAPPPVQRSTIAQPTGVSSVVVRPKRDVPRPSSSFLDADDESISAALDNEHRRIAERRRAQNGVLLDDGSVTGQSRQRPPHAGAADVEASVGVTAVRLPQDGGEIDGVPVLRMPAQQLNDAPVPRPGPLQKAPLNPHTANGSGNPRFTPRRKP